jgi:phosphatidylglycerophosphatase A
VSAKGGLKQKLTLFVAQGFGIGRSPVAPGTFGSLLGVGWYALLLFSGRSWVMLIGSALAIALSIWFCDRAEVILGQRDPGSVVLDEIVAIPVCFASWTLFYFQTHGALPGLKDLFANNWPVIAAIFLAFRVLDIVKPAPVRQSQGLPGGWGVVVDDLLAALYVNLLTLIARAMRLI